MGATSAIEWTHATFNPWWGCQRVSPGCQHCYAETFDRRVHGRNSHWGSAVDRRFFGSQHWAEPLKWNRQAAKTKERRRVFCASMADVFENRPELDHWRNELWGLIELTPDLDWLLLTKRPENFAKMLPSWMPRANVWLGVTAENQEQLDRRAPILLDTKAVIHFLSCEPLLGPLDLSAYNFATDWVIVGGESGSGARPMHPDWARSIRDQCVNAGISFFFKQWGDVFDGVRIGKKEAGRELDGRAWDEVPTVPIYLDERCSGGEE